MQKINYGVIADIHWGAPPHERLRDELSIFLDEFRIRRWEVLFIAGDLFHRKLSGNSPDMIEALRFMGEVFKLAVQFGTKIRIIHGTLSHDSEQLELVSAMEQVIGVDLKIINRVDSEEIFPGMHILYLPEEYMSNMDEYYAEHFNKKYDMIIGHGLVDKAAFIASVQESEETQTAAPIFPVKKLHEICYGPIYFGHIHKHMMVDRFRYVSSYTVWAYGETEPKGFMMGTYCIEEKMFEDFFVENTKRRRYDSVFVKEDSPLFNLPPQEAVYHILQTVKDVIKDNVRVEVTIPQTYEQTNLLVDLLNESIKGKPIKTKIISSNKEKMVEEIKKQVEDMMGAYKIIFDRNVPVEVKIAEFIKIENGIDIPSNEIHELLTEKIY